MAEWINPANQTIAPNGNAVFSYASCPCKTNDVTNRVGSGIFELKGNCCGSCGCTKEFYVSFVANIAVPADETPGPMTVALTLNGEALGEATAIVTTAVAERYFNIKVQKVVRVPKCSSYTISVRNASPIPIDMQNANLSIT